MKEWDLYPGNPREQQGCWMSVMTPGGRIIFFSCPNCGTIAKSGPAMLPQRWKWCCRSCHFAISLSFRD